MNINVRKRAYHKQLTLLLLTDRKCLMIAEQVFGSAGGKPIQTVLRIVYVAKVYFWTLSMHTGWPSVVREAPDNFVMMYHSAVFNLTPEGGISPQWALARAVSTDGVEWSKTGQVEITGRDDSPDAFDTKGLGTRDVVRLPSGGVQSSILYRSR